MASASFFSNSGSIDPQILVIIHEIADAANRFRVLVASTTISESCYRRQARLAQFENAAVVQTLQHFKTGQDRFGMLRRRLLTRECSSSRGSRLGNSRGNRSSHSFPSFRLVPLNLHESLPGMR